MSDVTQDEMAMDYSVSESWNKKFNLMKQAGVDDLPYMKLMAGGKFKALPFSDRNKVMMNIWAMVFGPLYYFAKKMWHKGAFILGASWLFSGTLLLVEGVLVKEIPAMVYWIVPAVICGQLANYDYYQSVVKGEKVWAWMPNVLTTTVGAIMFPVTAFVFVILIASGFNVLPSTEAPTCTSIEATDLVEEISKSEFKKYLTNDQLAAISFGLSSIRMTDTNDTSTAYMCSANLETVGGNGSHSTPITYKIQLLESGEYQINVFGLN